MCLEPCTTLTDWRLSAMMPPLALGAFELSHQIPRVSRTSALATTQHNLMREKIPSFVCSNILTSTVDYKPFPQGCIDKLEISMAGHAITT